MSAVRRKSSLVKGARVVSTIFSPLFIPTYCTVMAMWLTPLNLVSEHTRFLATAVVLALTCVFPTMIIFSMLKLGKVSDMDISNRRQRLVPLLLTLVCYALATLYMWRVLAPLWLVLYFMSGCVTALAVALISLRWKISAHGAGMGNMLGMVIAFMEGSYAVYNMLPWLCVIILLCGVVCSARVTLHRHTLGQVYAGTVLSAFITTAMMLIPHWIIQYLQSA